MLSSCRVLDLTTERGLLCGQILGDLGADVIKVEPPGGSAVRRMKPFFHDEPHPDRSLYWWSYNRNKRGITLNLEEAQGREILCRLAAHADFFLESETPGMLPAKGLGYREIAERNPAVVYVSITPFGQDGPKAHYADSDLIIMAAGGPLILYGDEDRPPIRMSVPQAYLHASVDAAAGALIAYYERLSSGRGQQVDISAQQSVGLMTQSLILAVPLRSEDAGRMAGGVKMGPLKVPLVWRAKDGQITFVFLFGSAIGPFTRRFMDHLYHAGGCDEATHSKDWIAFGDMLLNGKESLEEYDRIKGVIAAYFESKTKAELFKIAREHNILIAPIATIDEVLDNPQFESRGYWQTVEHPEIGQAFRYPGPFARFSAKPIAYRRRPPTVGEHNREIYVGELGMSEDEFDQLVRRGII